MRIVSWNVNGIRAVHRKGFLDWFQKEKADIVCLQEIKANIDQVPDDFKRLKGYFTFFNPAQRPGYAGTAVLSRQKPIEVKEKIGVDRVDKEGRVQILRYPEFTLMNFYMINGGGKEENMVDKLASYDLILDFLKKKDENMVIVGDFNIAHKEIDLARPKENVRNHGFTPPEREKIDKLLSLGFIDSFRKFHKEGRHYTWWTHFARARERNIGWRIDYIFVSKSLEKKIVNASISPSVMGSDHCPVGLDIKL